MVLLVFLRVVFFINRELKFLCERKVGPHMGLHFDLYCDEVILEFSPLKQCAYIMHRESEDWGNNTPMHCFEM